MGVRLDCRPADAAEQFAEARVARQVAAHDERVDEKPDQAFELGTTSPGDRCADGDIVLARVAVEEHLKCGQQRHVQSRALVSTEGSHRVERGLRQDRRPFAAALARDRRSGPIRGQLEIGHTRELLRPVIELRLEGRALEPVPLPDRVIGVLDRRARGAETARPAGMTGKAPRVRGSGSRSTSRRRWRGASSPWRCALARPVAAARHGRAVRARSNGRSASSANADLACCSRSSSGSSLRSSTVSGNSSLAAMTWRGTPPSATSVVRKASCRRTTSLRARSRAGMSSRPTSLTAAGI